MICPKCKNQIPEKALKCTHCGSRVATFCKKCSAYNSIFNLRCVSCNNELLKVCSSCKCVNLPNVSICRKCGNSFSQAATVASIQETTPREDKIEKQEKLNINEEQEHVTPQIESKEAEQAASVNLNYDTELYSQQKAKEALIDGILTHNKKVISVNGPKGIGKSIVLKSAIYELKDEEITWLLGDCSAITQLSPCGLVQDILLMFFNVSNFCSDSLNLRKDSQRFFQTEFPTLTNDEVFNLLNLLYPTNTDYFENILVNKDKTFTLLNKVFRTIIEKNKTVIVIENFDLIDGFSYEFLHNLLNSNFTMGQVKFLLTYNDIRPSRGYLYSDKLKENSYLDIALNLFDKNQMNSFIEQHFPNSQCPSSIKETLYKLSAGNVASLEQFVSLLSDYNAKYNSFECSFPATLNDAIKMRLNYLKADTNAYKLLALASIQGVKFYPSILNQILDLDEKLLSATLKSLQELNFISSVNEFTYVFKNSALWSAVFDTIKNDDNFVHLNKCLFSVYSNYTLSTNSIMAIISQNINQDLSALTYWSHNIKLAAYIGDTNLYAISQKQCLVFSDKLDEVKDTPIRNNIYERLGKLLSKSNPSEAIEYLPIAISNAKKLDNTIKEIELTGYLASCCISLGDYYGTIECIDSAINKLDYNFDLEIAMLKSRKLNALLNIGNCGEIINLVDNEIMPVFDKYISSKQHKNISIKVLYKAWLNTYLTLAYALAFQGNCRSFEVLSTLFELIQKNKLEVELFICKTKLAFAFANTIKGDFDASEDILSEIIKVYGTDIMDNETISRWNLVNILNNFLRKKYVGLKEELFQVVTFANNVNDNFTKNILKTLLGKLIKDEENAKRALEIYGEQITYFSKEKNAIGALLCWYLIAEANLIAEGPEKSLEVSQKALDIAQSPKINNYIFIVLYNKVIAEAYMAQAEYELARVHIEKSILVAKKFEMLNFLADLYLLYGKYLQDISLVVSETKVEYISNAAKMYKKADLIAQGINNAHLSAKIEKARSVLHSFCQLNGITLKDS